MDKSDDVLDIDQENDTDEQSLIEFDIATYPSDYTLSVLYEMWKNKSIIIPDYQRDFVWSINQSSLLIESFLISWGIIPRPSGRFKNRQNPINWIDERICTQIP